MTKSMFKIESLDGLIATLKAVGAVPRLRVLKALCSQYTFQTSMLAQILKVFEYGQNSIEAMAILFGRVADQQNLPTVCEDLLGVKGLTKLVEIVGPLFTFNRDNPCGHYRLDLGNDHCHIVLRQLASISSDHIHTRSEANMFDLSQHGNLECFRNETLDNAPLEIRSEDVSGKWTQLNTTFPLLVRHKGILEFDFVPSTRPPGDVQEISDKNMERLMKRVRRMKKEPPHKLVAWLRWEAAENYFLVKQATEILDAAATDDSLREEMIMLMWNRIVDEENIVDGLILKLSEKSQFDLRRRIGPLKLFNPLNPCMQYTLQLSMRDERLVARFLLELAAKEYPEAESGVGLQPAGTLDEQKGDDKGPVELKKVPEVWMESPPEGGLPTSGIWCVTYEPPLVDAPPELNTTEEADEESEEEDEEEQLQKRHDATNSKHAAFRAMIATKLLGWSFPSPEEADDGTAGTS